MGFGEKLRTAMERLKNSSSLDRETVKEAVKEIQRALISSDVEVNLVLEVAAGFTDKNNIRVGDKVEFSL